MALSGQSFAQSSESDSLLPTLETMVVVSSRQEQPLRQVATSVSVLTEAQIKAQGHTALADTLRTLPSVSVTNSGGMGKASSIRVRGESGYRTLVRVDGVDVTDPTGTQASAQIQHIMSSSVGRVELLRGPQGLMYGADAGGVLNITTRAAEPSHQLSATAEAGSYSSERYGLSLGGAGESGDYFVSASHVTSDGFNTSLNDTELADDDGYENTSVHVRGGWNATESLRLEAVVRDTEATNEFDRCGWPYADDCVGDFDQTNARISIAHTSDVFDNALAFSKTDVSRKNYAAVEVSYDTEGDIEKLEWTGQAKLSETHKLAYGAEQRTDTVLELERDQWGAYAEYQGNYADTVYLTAGVRRDDSDDFGDYDSYRVSAAYLLDLAAGSLKFKSSFGTGFRAPSLFEIDYNRQNYAHLPALTPEESEGLDLGVEYYSNQGLRLELVYFDQSIEREIDWDSGYIQSQGQSDSEGIELAADFPVADWLVVNANYTYTDATTTEQAVRARQPENMANLGVLLLPFDGLQASFSVRTADGTYDRFGDPIGSYQVLDVNVRYTLSEHFTVYVRGENLTDENYVEVPGYRTAGASGYVGVEVSF